MELNSTKTADYTDVHSNGISWNGYVNGKRWRLIALFFLLVSIGLAIALIVVIVQKEDRDSQTHLVPEQITKTCNTSKGNYGKIELGLPETPGVFVHLTEQEIRNVRKFLYSRPELNLVDMENFSLDKSFIHSSDLYLPDKQSVLNFLDNNGPKPPREAQVIVYRGDENPPYIEEIIVGPLPDPTSYRPVPFRPRKIPYEYRVPFGAGEYVQINRYLVETFDTQLQTMLMELYGGKMKDCVDDCLIFDIFVPVSPVYTTGRKQWLTLCQRTEYAKHHPLDLSVLVEIGITSIDVDKVWFNGSLFSSLNEVLDFYNNNKDSIIKVPYPVHSSDSFSVLSQRGTPPMDPPLQNPQQVSPDGKRYNIKGRHVQYMFWNFDVRMDLISGPHIYDVRFNNERIAYELSLQEIAVQYSGHGPADMFAQLLDSLGLLGTRAQLLYPGIDCPLDATFIPSTFDIGFEDPITLQSTFCVFELNTGKPLRRHHSRYFEQGRFFAGMETIVLVLRTIFMIGEYDYFVDLMFYDTGAIEIKITATGYVKAMFYRDADQPYSFKLHDNFGAPIHHHMFHLKLDLDIKGTSNRFATLDIDTIEVPDPYFANSSRILQQKFSTTVKSTESEASYHYNFDSPKYLVMYNENSKDRFGNRKGYRILNRGMSKQVLPQGSGNEPLFNWSRYQLAVTKFNDSERTSTSIYATYDRPDPVVNFENYINNDSILDEDLVAWVTMGNQHIPHTEDLPVTTTPAMDVSVFLMPFNYFEEDPSIASKNAFRIEPTKRNQRGSDFIIHRYGVKQEVQCTPQYTDYDTLVKMFSSWVFEN